MTQEQFEILVAKLNAIQKAVAPNVIDNPLVGTGEPKPIAPSVAQVAADPGFYSGSLWDPIDRKKHVNNTLVISRFESMDKAGDFVGGTLADWARKDLPAFKRYIENDWPGFRWDRLSESQRAFLGIV